MILFDLYKAADAKLKGAPNDILTVALILIALAAFVIALKAPPLVKGAVLAWMVLP